jgi:uncharacterized membrane protein YeiH
MRSSLPYLLDLAGTFVFALSGAAAGVKNRLDLFGVLALSFAAANTGGISRDLLIGAVPPGAIADWHYVAVSIAAGLLTFCFPAGIMRRWSPVLWFDAGGLALFAVSGAHKALVHGLKPVHGHPAGDVDRDRWRHGARHPPGRKRRPCCGPSCTPWRPCSVQPSW